MNIISESTRRLDEIKYIKNLLSDEKITFEEYVSKERNDLLRQIASELRELNQIKK